MHWPEATEGEEVCSAVCYELSTGQPPSSQDSMLSLGSLNLLPSQFLPEEDAVVVAADVKAPTAKKRGRPKGSTNKAPTTPATPATPALPAKTMRSEAIYRNVAFKPLQEVEIHKNDKKLLAFYADTGNYMLSGVVTEVKYVIGTEHDMDWETPGKKSKTALKALVAMHKITWGHTRFQREEPLVSSTLFFKGIEQYATLKANQRMNAGRSYLQICAYRPDEEMHEMSEFEMKTLNAIDDMDDETKEDEPRGKKGTYETTEDIEGVDNVDWEFGAHFDGPRNLFEHGDDGPDDELRIVDEFKDKFKDPVKGFLGFMPMDYWKGVVTMANNKAKVLEAAHAKRFVGGREFKKPLDIVEVMKFMGLLVMMSVVRGGEYSLYWSNPSMSFLMPNCENFGKVMSINRFKQLRACITFNDVPVAEDPLWRIRPLVNLLKASFKNFVVAGLINMDNWYSSVQLCMTLSNMGLYCRGTVRGNRAHNPRFGMFDKKQVKSVQRGSSLVSVARDQGIIAVSWLDGTVVNLLSTADSTTKSYVKRRVGGNTTQQQCFSLVGLYNMYMQGVDRHDQLRERFSIASGASFKHWYRKLGFALIDIAITNLFVLWSLGDRVNRRDAHMYFQTRLAN
ncbi:hypothetical protein DYB34_001834 [Aphanomyces astaci]|uniref:PiggyBac transposable element-derived protein domain-containing protein n=1 Tax=Aphanomyces astaci TaxID=112090 RepID=A0A418BYX8_APHAT|nr:hypothetical protein DYB34_001834 [Aphanomyces astaci]